MPEELIIDTQSLRWYHFDDPEDPELTILAPEFDLHPLSLEDCVSPSQRAKMDDFGSHLFFILNTLHFNVEDEILIIGKLCVFAGSDFVITVSNGKSRTVDHVRARITAGHAYTASDELVHALMDFVCDQFQPLIDQISDDIGELESRVYERPDPAASMRAFGIKRVLISLRRVGAAHREIINKLLHRDPPFVSQNLNLYFRDIYDHIVLALELIESNRDLVLGIIDVNLSATAHRTNEIVKVLTMYATILLPLNLVTGFFGMNFHYMPLLDEKFGVPLVCAVMLITTYLISRYLATREW
ncbi:MAG TPA: magnesium/cobalt transporter CorA [Candidatus Obscuribacterales bacterium]